MQNNPIGWFEIYANDIERARKFYETVLAVKLHKMESPTKDLQMYGFSGDMKAPGASGALCQMNGFEARSGSVLIYFSCADCAAEESRVVAAGGRIQKKKEAIGPHGFITLAIDTEGNMFGLHSMK